MTSPEIKLLQRASDGVRTALGVAGLIAIVLGLLILFAPVKSGAIALQLVAAIVAAYLLVMGVTYIGASLFSRDQKGWTRVGHIALGALYLLGGVLVMVNLGGTAVVIAWFLSITIGVLWILEGVTAFMALGGGAAKTNVWNIIYGIISVIAGLALIFMPLISAITLWWLLGISMVVMGVVQVVRALKVHHAQA